MQRLNNSKALEMEEEEEEESCHPCLNSGIIFFYQR